MYKNSVPHLIVIGKASQVLGLCSQQWQHGAGVGSIAALLPVEIQNSEIETWRY